MNAYWKGIVLGLVVLSAPVMAQEKPAVWDLKSCINYARHIIFRFGKVGSHGKKV